MIKHGVPPYLECSSRGDKRFSAFHAIVQGRSIEDWYQSAKIFEDGSTNLSWREAKGRRAVNQEALSVFYETLWRQYLREHQELIVVLKQATGLSDMFGQVGHVCQVTTLWKLRNEESI